MQQIKVMPLGGFGEIGHNMVLIESPNEGIIIDCGVLFPNESHYSVQYLVPDFTKLDKKLITKLILTHGHEDHIGAIPLFLLEFPNIQIYCSKFTKELLLIKAKRFFTNYPILNSPQSIPSLEQIEQNITLFNSESCLSFLHLNIYPIHVNHSIPETFGLLIQDHQKLVSLFYCSDCKFDDHSPYEKPFDFERLNTLAKDSQSRVLLLDSTNILNKHKTPSEGDILLPLGNLLSSLKKRVFITLFPSNIHRIQTIISLAKKSHKKIVYYGQSLVTYCELALKLGLLDKTYKETLLTHSGEDDCKKVVTNYSSDEMIILLTGCQGDLKGALNRVVSGHDPLFKLVPGDTILFSSRVIPGNEKRLNTIYNKIYKQKATIITANDSLIHVSGHAGQEDLQHIITQFNPTHFFPIHGEIYFLYKHIEFTKKLIPNIKSEILTNYDELTIKFSGDFLITPKDMQPPLLIDEFGLVLNKSVLNERRKLSQFGVFILSMNIKQLHLYLNTKRELQISKMLLEEGETIPFDSGIKISSIGLELNDKSRIELFTILMIYFSKNRISELSFTEKNNHLKIKNQEEQLRVYLKQYFKKIYGNPSLIIIHFN